MFGRLGDLFEEAGLFAQEVAFNAIHPEIWTGSGSKCEGEDEIDKIENLSDSCPTPNFDKSFIGKVNSAFDTSTEVKVLLIEDKQQIAAVYVKKAEILNTVMRQHTAQGHSEVYSAIQNVKKLADILERNLQGKMTANDVLEMEQQMPTWCKEIGSLVKTFDDIM